MERNDFQNRLSTMILVAVMATIGTLFATSTFGSYLILKDNYRFAEQSAELVGWTDELTAEAKAAEAALKEYADSNLLAGVIYSLNGNLGKKIVQWVIIFLVCAGGICTVVYDVQTVIQVIETIIWIACRRSRKRRQNQRNRKISKISSIDDARKRTKRKA